MGGRTYKANATPAQLGRRAHENQVMRFNRIESRTAETWAQRCKAVYIARRQSIDSVQSCRVNFHPCERLGLNREYPIYLERRADQERHLDSVK